MKETLEKCKAQFEFYAQEHLKAGKVEKAATNQKFADMCDEALSSQSPKIGDGTIQLLTGKVPSDAVQSPKIGDGTIDAALAIGEHAFRAGWDAGVKHRGTEFNHHYHDAWSDYDPPEDIKALA